jgi:hypothetical protein
MSTQSKSGLAFQAEQAAKQNILDFYKEQMTHLIELSGGNVERANFMIKTVISGLDSSLTAYRSKVQIYTRELEVERQLANTLQTA